MNKNLEVKTIEIYKAELIELEKDQKKQAEINEVLEESTVKFSDVDGTQQIIEIEKVLAKKEVIKVYSSDGVCIAQISKKYLSDINIYNDSVHFLYEDGGVISFVIYDALNVTDIVTKVTESLDSKIDIDGLKNEINKSIKSGKELLKYDGMNYTRIIDIIVPDKAGHFLQKEGLEFFDLPVNEKRYNNQFGSYLNKLEREVLKYSDDWFNLNINDSFDGAVNCRIDFKNGELVLILTVEHDYLPEDAKKAFRSGIDEDIYQNFLGYVSRWEIDGYNLFLYSNYNCDEDEFIYNIIEIESDEVKEILEENKNPLLPFAGYDSIEQLYNYESELSILQLIADYNYGLLHPYSNSNCGFEQVKTHLEVIYDVLNY